MTPPPVIMATTRPINILVYAGEGATPTALRHAFSSLRQLLSPYYVVLPVSAAALLTEPWQASCAALVLPGGADLPFCRLLNGAGNRRIRRYVDEGGVFVGFCAGGYYASARCEFMQGDPIMEVVGERELGFYPGICRGLAFKGFRYQSEQGARAARIVAHQGPFDGIGKAGSIPSEAFAVYYNGGGVFVDASRFREDGVEVLADYADKVDIDSGNDTATVVYRPVGKGHVLLTGLHPEFDPTILEKNKHGDRYVKTVEELERDDAHRRAFLKACFVKLGLQVDPNPQPVPSLSPLHLSSSSPHSVSTLLPKWKSFLTRSRSGQVTLVGDGDKFHLRNLPDSYLPLQSSNAPENDLDISSLTVDSEKEVDDVSGSEVDYDKIAKHMIIHIDGRPSLKETPAFNHALFYDSLEQCTSYRRDFTFGKYILYGEVVTSTSTMLEKNDNLLRTLPSGFTATASTQLTGRGRGTNVWASPRGSLMFSTVVHHPAALAHSSPVVFVQYLAGMATVRAVRAYGSEYAGLPVRIKWPNDVYAERPAEGDGEGDGGDGAGSAGSGGRGKDWAKVAGVLVTSSYAADAAAYRLLIGVGVNVANSAPTTGLDAVARARGLAPLRPERLLALMLAELEELHRTFCDEGWGSRLEQEYLGMWLHSDQIVSVESEGGLRARIKGITRDWGLLLAEELDRHERSTGHMIALQSDSNSFDFFKGLIKRKV